MNTVTVNTSRSYRIHIGKDILRLAGKLMQDNGLKPCKAAIISDSNVAPLYADTLTASLRSDGFETVSFTFPAGEASKNLTTYQNILEFLAENHVTRADTVIALGGGVTGDMAGFAAATYLRGISYVQIPTSLLAMVDSSVGGKTAIDLPVGKNLVGAFYQPRLVICDTLALNTLPENVFRDGCAEVIKYGVLYDANLFAHLSKKGSGFDRDYVITRCVELKRDVVIADEYDTGARQKLNLGHTVGHGIEATSHFTVTHGNAVAAGMCIIAKAAVKHGICDPGTENAIFAAVQKFGLPTGTERTARELAQCAMSDKKRFGDTVNLILPQKIGDCIVSPTPTDQLELFIEAGL